VNTSLRARIMSGAVLWTVGLFILAMIVSTAIMLRFRVSAIFVHGMASAHGVALLGVVGIAMLAGFVLVRRALEPLWSLRESLALVRSGRERQVLGVYPAEVQPLVDELNGLLEHHDQAVRRAVAKAGDLAHGLKTPLAVLAHEADRARTLGQVELAETMTQQVERMRRQLEYHLAHARAAASGATANARASVMDAATALVRTLERLHADRRITLDLDVDPLHVVRTQPEDLEEMLGNLLDNAFKWTRSRVSIASRVVDGRVEIMVEDDGPGVTPSMRHRVLQRGVRADEASPGSGLGLAIVRDLAELYGGSIAIDNLPQGGLNATLRLPQHVARST
jgi:signal transduction histidine kinase